MCTCKSCSSVSNGESSHAITLLNASVFSKYKKVLMWMCLCITLCAGLKMPGCTYECLSLVVCVSEGICVLSERSKQHAP